MPGSVGQFSQGWLPWQGVKATSGTWVRTNGSAELGMGSFEQQATATINDYVEWDVWLDVGTWKFALVHWKDTNVGIYTFKLDGVSVGTIDGYAAAQAKNSYAEITGISVTTAGVKTLRIIMESKNATSSNYKAYLQSIALIRTAGTASTPAGSDTPGYTWMFLPWMGEKTSSAAAIRTQGSARLGGGYARWGGLVDNSATWDVWLDVGTYKFAAIGLTASDSGISTIRLDGVDKGTMDWYSAGNVENVYKEVTGIVIATAGVKVFSMAAPTKNATSTAYNQYLNSVAWIRTGA